MSSAVPTPKEDTFRRLDGVRVLQVVGDSDATHDNLAALDLHRRLDRDGLEVRTLALAPGGVGGLAPVLPTMAPTARSLAAHTQLRREQRWADVVVLRGVPAASAAGLARMRAAPPTVLVMSEVPISWRSGPIPSRVLRCAGAVQSLVVAEREDVELASMLDAEGGRIRVIPIGVDLPPVTTDARRAAARARLGVPPDGTVVFVVTDDATDDGDLRRMVAEIDSAGAHWTCAPRVDHRSVRFGSTPEERAEELADASELAVAAADLVTVVGQLDVMPSSLIRAMGSGLAMIGDGPAGASVPSIRAAAELDAQSIRERGLRAAELVGERWAFDVVAPLWHALLVETLA